MSVEGMEDSFAIPEAGSCFFTVLKGNVNDNPVHILTLDLLFQDSAKTSSPFWGKKRLCQFHFVYYNLTGSEMLAEVT